MKAVILAGGKSSRLYPITSNLPKCLLPLGSLTVLDYQIQALLGSHIRRVVLVVGFYKEKIISHMESHYGDKLQITFIEDPDYMTANAAHGLWMAKNELLEESIIFLHGDVLFQPQVLNKLLAQEEENVLLFCKNPYDEESGKLMIDEKNNVLKLGKKLSKDETSGEYMQIAKFSQSYNQMLVATLEQKIIQENQLSSYTIDIFHETVQRGATIKATEVPPFGITEIDTPEDYKKAQSLIQSWS